MAAQPIKVPVVGESITEGILARWLISEGARVQAGDALFELETDKASTVVPAPASGFLRIAMAEGSTVEIGATIGILDTEPATTATKLAVAKSAPLASQPTSAPNVGTAPLSPAVRRIVAEGNVDLMSVTATGPGGRVTKGDVLAFQEAAASSAPILTAPHSAPSPPLPVASVVDLAIKDAPSPPRETRQRMSGIRQRIAQRLVEAQQTAAILTTFNEADLSRIVEIRTSHKDAFQKKHGVSLGFMSFFVKASIEALKAFPAVNARIDGADIVFSHSYDIGVAVSTDRGLMVPVVRDADRMSFAQIEKSIGEFAKKARENTITVADLQGGTFTITNGGVFGSLLSTPILNPPQSGILGMHAIQKRPVVVDDQVVIRPMMYLAFSYDHRIVDGREAVGFLVCIKDHVEHPERFLLDV